MNCRSCNKVITHISFKFKAPINIWPQYKSLILSYIFLRRKKIEIYQCNFCSLVQLQQMSDSMIRKIYKGSYSNQEYSSELRTDSFNSLLKIIEKEHISCLEIGGLNTIEVKHTNVI